MLSRAERLPGDALPHLNVSIQVFGQQALFHPLEPVRAECFGQADGVLDVEGHPAVEHQLCVVADQFAGFGDHLFVFTEAVEAVGRAVGAGDLEGAKSELLEPVEVVAGRIAELPLLLGAADQAVDGLAQKLALGIPERQVDGADGVGCEADRAVGLCHAEHHIGQSLDCEPVFADEVGRDVIVDDRGGDAAVVSLPQPPGAVLERDLAPDRSPALWRPEATVPLDLGIPGHWVGDFGGLGPGLAARPGACGRGGEVYADRLNIGNLHSRGFLGWARKMSAVSRRLRPVWAQTDCATGRYLKNAAMSKRKRPAPDIQPAAARRCQCA